MALDVMQVADIIGALEDFLQKRRPPKELRHELDIMYQIDGQSIIIFEVRPNWQKKTELIECPFAKATWVDSRKRWKLFWMRADLKWHAYPPNPEVKTIQEVLAIVDADEHHCFFG